METTAAYSELVIDWSAGRRFHVRTRDPIAPRDQEQLRNAARRARQAGPFADVVAFTLGKSVRILSNRPSPEIILEVDL